MVLLGQCKQKSLESSTSESRTSNREVVYQYDEKGRLVQERLESSFTVGETPYNLNTITTYSYDAKGRKIRVEEHDSDSNELLTTTLFDYDSRDSLLSEYIIDIHGDTTSLVENKYGKNGNLQLKKYRQLLNRQSEDDMLNGKSNYDTLFSLTENFYQAGLLTRTTIRNRLNILETEREYEYVGQRLTKMRVYEFPESRKQLLTTVNYFLQANASPLERVTVNILGDTVGIKKVEKNGDGKLSKIIEVNKEIGDIFIMNFNNREQLVTEIIIIKDIGKKMTSFYTYDSSGRKVKVIDLDEPLTEKEKNML